MRALTLRTLSALVLALVTWPTAAEMQLEDVLAKHVDARGGRDAWTAVDNLRISGSYDSFSRSGPFTRVQTRDGRFRMEYHLGLKPVTKAHNGSVAWWINSMREPKPTEIDGPDMQVFERELDFPNALFHADQFEATLVGPADFEGMEVLQIDLTRSDGSQESWYLDPESYLEVALSSPGSDFGRPMPQRTFFDDFRQVGDVQIPYYVESQWYTRVRVQNISDVELNVELDPAQFDMPPPLGMGPWIALAGSWEVESQRNQGAESEPVTSELKSEMELLLGDTLVQERYTKEGDEVMISVTFDRFQEVYRRTAIDSDRGFLDVQVGKQREDGSIVLDNLETGTFLMAGERKVNLRTTYADLSADCFTMVIEFSLDEGTTWNETARSVYRRAKD